MAKFVRKGSDPATAAAAAKLEGPCPLIAGHPALVEYLTLSTWDDGKPRQTATLMICFEDGRYRGCVNDRASQRSAWVSAWSLTGLLEAIEAGLQGDSLEFRRAKWQGKGR